MAGAFQANAFQNNAFQTGEAIVVPTRKTVGVRFEATSRPANISRGKR